MTLSPSRRGFVLPIVILLMLVVSLVAAVMLARSDAQTRTVQRQLGAYQAYHSVQGLRQTLEAWMNGQQAGSLDEVVDPDGFVFRVEPGDGTAMAMYLFDGQGVVTTSTSGVPAEQAAVLEAARATLEQRFGAEAAARYTRGVGPWQISLNAAPEPVVRAVVEALVSSERSGRLVDEIIERRSGPEPMDREALGEAMNTANLDASERASVNQYFTVEPTLWEFVVDVRGAGPNAGLGLLARYRALTIFASRISTNVNQYEQPAPFLSWSSEKIDASTVSPPMPRGESARGVGRGVGQGGGRSGRGMERGA